jgi:hypothetical protein
MLFTLKRRELRPNVVLLSEDMQHGFVYRGVTVINPFAEPAHPLLADALRYRR